MCWPWAAACFFLGSAPGTMILSTRTTQVAYSKTVGWQSYAANSNYTYNGGTSMATPLVAGCAALVRQWLVERRGFAGTPPTAALMAPAAARRSTRRLPMT